MSHSNVSDNKYRIFVSSGTNLDGSRRRYSKTITTKLKGKDLDKFLTLAEYAFEDEIKASSTNYNNMAADTFSNYVEWWLGYAELTEQTRESYKYNLKFIEQHIGHKVLSKLTKADMLELLEILKLKKNANTGGPISERTIRNYMNILKAAFRDAIDLEIIHKNPMDNIKFKVSDYQLEDNYYDVEDINKMIFAIDDELIKYQFAILFTLATGLRLGELLALEESDFNYTDNSVKISKSLSEIKGSRKLGQTKTKKTRVEFYPGELNDLLEKHLENETLKKEMLGVENDLIFTSTIGTYMPKRTLQDWFKRFIERKGLKPLTYHGLRHTSATMLLANGIPLKNVAERLGHSRASTTANIYAHAIPRFDKDASNVFSEMLSTGSESGSRNEKLRVVK